MITQFKPTPRLITIASAIFVLALGCFTFTRAADKEAAPQATEKSKVDPAPSKENEDTKAGIKVIEKEWAKQNALVEQKQKEVDALKEKLNISPFDEALYNDSGDFNPEILRKLESIRVEAMASYNQVNTLYTYLSSLTRAEFRRAAQTAIPDVQLTSLMDHLAEAEVRLAGEELDHSDTHPDLIKMRHIVKKINQQIDDRLDGILAGLNARAASAKAHLDAIQKEMDKTMKTKTDFATTMPWRAYVTAKHDLESLRFLREKIALRIIQEKIDMAIEKSK